MFNEIKKNQEKIEKDLTKERNERCIPVAQKVLVIMSKGKIDDKPQNEMYNEYKDIARELLKEYLDAKLKLSDIKYVHKLALQAFQISEDLVNQTLNGHLKAATASYWGKDGEEVTVVDLDEKIKGINKQ